MALAAYSITPDDDVDSALAKISARESGNQNIPNTEGPGGTPASTASGYWQITNPTWNDFAPRAGVDLSKYPRAIDAPPDVQKSVAKAIYMARGEEPWITSAPGYQGSARASMPDTSTSTDTSAGTGILNMPAVSSSPEDVQRMLQIMNMGQPQPDGTQPSFIARIGEALGGGGGNLSGAQREQAGTRALLNFGIGLLANSGYHPVRTTLGEAMAAGLSGAQNAEIGSQGMAFEQQKLQRDQVAKALDILGAQQGRQIQAGQLGIQQQEAAIKQQQLQIELAKLRAVQNMPSPFGMPPATVGPAPTAPVAKPAASVTTAAAPPTVGPVPGEPAEAPPIPLPTPTGGPAPVAPTAVKLGAGPLEVKSREEYLQAHPFTPTPEQQTLFNTQPDPAVIANFEQQKNMAMAAYETAKAGMDTAGMATALDKYNTAVSAENTLRQSAVEKGNANKQAAIENWNKSLTESYNTAIANQQTLQADLTKSRQAQDIQSGNKLLEAMDTQALKAHQMNTGLAQLIPLLPKLPGGALGAFLQSNPDMLGMLKVAGVVNPETADAVRTIQGLTSYMAAEMKPAGLGAMREYEFNAFRAALPDMLRTTAGQQKALAMLFNMNDRIQQETAYAHQQFEAPVADPGAPGGTRPAYKMPADLFTSMNAPPVMQNGVRVGGGLGPVFPTYSGPANDAGALKAWEGTLEPGRAYRKPMGVYEKDAGGQYKLDANGRAIPVLNPDGTMKTEMGVAVRPWQ